MAIYFPSRPLLEAAIRRRIRATDNIVISEDTDAGELIFSSTRNRITGVQITTRAEGGTRQEIAAGLTVDAMGRGAHTPAILEELGYGQPQELHVKTRTCYVSQPPRIIPGTLRELLVNIHPVPGRPSGMFLTTNENDIAIFTAFGIGGCEPPTEFDQMISFAEKYAPARFLDGIRSAAPLGSPYRYRLPSSQWRRYDKMRRFPDGLLVFGDATCSFNPIYGQGMTVSALESLALRHCLASGPDKLARRYFRAAAKPIGIAWQLATTSDLNFPEVEGVRTPVSRINARLTERLLTACETDAVVGARFFRVSGFIDPPMRLLRPSIIRRTAIAHGR